MAVVAVDPGNALCWQVLGFGATVGVMSSVIPYSLELVALRRLPPETFAILTCLSPVRGDRAGDGGQHRAVRSARDRLGRSDTRLITA